MQTTVSSKGQIVLPAPMRRALGLRSKSKVLIEECDGGIFICPVRKSRPFAPIDYLPPGAITLSDDMLKFDALAGEDDSPQP